LSNIDEYPLRIAVDPLQKVLTFMWEVGGKLCATSFRSCVSLETDSIVVKPELTVKSPE
jgi:hypothetical protein